MLRLAYIFKQFSDSSCHLSVSTLEYLIGGFEIIIRYEHVLFYGQACGYLNQENVL